MPKGLGGVIDAIFFDMNGTLQRREPHVPTQRAATARLQELLGMKDITDAYWDELACRQKKYSRWAQQHLIQLSEEEIWTRWILPEVPPEKIKPIAAELTLAWKERKGRTVPRPGAVETIVELKRRGYRLGVISNTMSSLEIPRSLEKYGWTEFFEVVILSSAISFRKPAPEPFLEATNALRVKPAHCAYLGNRISKDFVGCKRAGFAFGIIFEPPGEPNQTVKDHAIQPDAVIHSLHDLLGIFPPRTPMEGER